eukprot:GAHX01002201.1.p1 GENE.GAHX01002201.1~~GAHX01002201.1.p1  ORF type:complete len:1261 (-),score=297.70 GAHX01002201.1:36-3818(-)
MSNKSDNEEDDFLNSILDQIDDNPEDTKKSASITSNLPIEAKTIKTKSISTPETAYITSPTTNKSNTEAISSDDQQGPHFQDETSSYDSNSESSFQPFTAPNIDIPIETTSDSFDNLDAFLYDIKPDITNPSRLILYCKMCSSYFNKNVAPTYITVTFIVTNIETQLYYLRRQFVIADSKNLASITDREASYSICVDEIQAIRKRLGVQKIRTKAFVKKTIPGLFNSDNVTSEEENCVKVVYVNNNTPLTPTNDYLKGKTFCHVSGANTPIDTSFVLEKKIRGPVWIKVNKARLRNIKKKNPCLVIDDPNDVNINLTNQIEPPLFDVSIINIKHSTKVLFYATVTTFSKFNFMHSDIKELSTKFLPNTISFVYIPKGKTSEQAKDGLSIYSKKKGITLKMFDNLNQLLFGLTNFLNKLDSDIIMGYDLLEDTLEFLISLLHEKKLKGNLTYSRKPIISKHGKQYTSKANKVLNNFEGRLLADSFLLTKEFTSLTTYSLQEISEQLSQMVCLKNFNLNIVSNIDAEHVQKTTSVLSNAGNRQLLPSIEAYLDFLINNSKINMISFFIVIKLNTFPLTYQLSINCGCTWQTSLLIKRSIRTDFLLLHEFNSNNFLLPERIGPFKEKKSDVKFEGGLVLDPKVGFYNNPIILLDFNSLYPSIIIEYNLCFSTLPLLINSNDMNADNLESVNYKKGIIPQILTKLLTQRKVCKEALSDLKKKGSDELIKLNQLEIQQKALKLTANSLYGSLGYKRSLFYCAKIPALVTFLGRSILSETVKKANGLNKGNVIYGDTDSIMISTSITDSDEMGTYINAVKNSINRQYKNIYLELECIFKKLLIIKKKKYAALKILNFTAKQPKTEIEMKGLDLVRRDNCVLVRKICTEILNIILLENNKQEEDLYLDIFILLEKLIEDLNTNKVDFRDFLITKAINKNIDSYNKENTPHIYLADRLNKKGGKFGMGKRISYLICEGEGKLCEKVYVIEELYEKKLKIDVEYYIKHQIFPAIMRLLEVFMKDSIETIYKIFNITKHSNENKEFDKMSELNERELDENCLFSTFYDVKNYKIRCPICKKIQNWNGVDGINYESIKNAEDKLEVFNSLLLKSLQCTEDCNGFFHYSDLKELKGQLRGFMNEPFFNMNKFILEYNKSGFECGHERCNFETNFPLSIYNDKRRNHKCGNHLKQKYDRSEAFKRVDYLCYITDVELKALEFGIDLENVVLEKKYKNAIVIYKVMNEIGAKLSKNLLKYKNIEIGYEKYEHIF